MPAHAPSKILVVEDDDIVRMLMVDVLEELEFSVAEADSWDAAADQLHTDQGIDLLITDVGLGDANKDGVDLAKLALQLRPGLPVLVASGYGNTMELPEGVQTLGKPFNIDSLRDAVRALLPTDTNA
jgi:DNA-binding NtrC family response regulator